MYDCYPFGRGPLGHSRALGGGALHWLARWGTAIVLKGGGALHSAGEGPIDLCTRYIWDGHEKGEGERRARAHTNTHTHTAKEAAGSLIRLFLRIDSSDLHLLLHTSPCPPAYHFVPSRIYRQPVPVRPHPYGRRAAVGARARGHSVFFFPSVANSWLTGESQRAWPRRSPHEENAGPRGRGRESLLLSFV